MNLDPAKASKRDEFQRKSLIEKIEQVNRRRKYLRATKPFSISPVINDILIAIYYANLKDTPVNVTSVITYCRGSERTIRTHLKSLIDDGWVAARVPDDDKRESRLVLTEEGAKLLRTYIDLF